MRASIVTLEEAGSSGSVQALRSQVYSHYREAHDEAWHAEVYEWLYTHPLAQRLYRWVAVSGDEVVGHLAAVPQYYRIGGERIVAHTPADYMALPGYGFAAFSMMKRFYAAVDDHVACDMVPEVIRLETSLGSELAGPLDYAAKLLDVSQLPVPRLPAPLERRLGMRPTAAAGGSGAHSAGASGEGGEEVREVPPVRPRLPIPTPVQRALNAGLGAIDAVLQAASSRGAKVVELEGFDESFDIFFERIAASVACTPEKDAAFLRWRYGPGSPQHPVTVLAAREKNELLGYAVLRVTRESMRGFREAFILDLSVLPERPEASRALLAAAVGRFREAGVPMVRYRYSSSPTSPTVADLARLGFFHRRGRSNSLLVGLADERHQQLARDLDNWSYNLGDGEATFWVP